MDGRSFNLRLKSLTSPICRRPHFSNFSCHRITLRVWMWSSCSTSHWKYEYRLKLNHKYEFRRSWAEKSIFPQIFHFFIFFGSEVPPLFGILTSIKLIDVKILPASIYSRSSSIRKWIQIEIWMDGGSFNFEFKSLTSSICCRPHFSNFSCHRITLRVWMWSSCSTSHQALSDYGFKSKFERMEDDLISNSNP